MDYSKIDFTLRDVAVIRMEKSIYSSDYSLFLEQLRQARDKQSLTQAQVAERLGQTQSFVSKVERGERRLDIVELRVFCEALGVPFAQFVTSIDRLLQNAHGKTAS